jgi:hypothetical protein
LIFDIEADRIQYLSFDPKKVESERGGGGVGSGGPEVDASNSGIPRRAAAGDRRSSLTRISGRWSGWMSDIEHWTMDDLKHHFEMGLRAKQRDDGGGRRRLRRKRFFSSAKNISSDSTARAASDVTTVEPEQMGERRLVVRQGSGVAAAGRSPTTCQQTNNPDFYALNILRTVLVQGRELAHVPTAD